MRQKKRFRCCSSDRRTDPRGGQQKRPQDTGGRQRFGIDDDTTLDTLSAIGSVSVDHGVFSVEINIPESFASEISDEDLEKAVNEKGYKTARRNSDGTVTYVMSKAQHRELMDGIETSLRESMDEMIGSEAYPSFTAIEANDDYTVFRVTTRSAELSINESFSVMAFYVYGGMYGIFNGTPADNIRVEFINADTGEIMNTANSKDMETGG